MPRFGVHIFVVGGFLFVAFGLVYFATLQTWLDRNLLGDIFLCDTTPPMGSRCFCPVVYIVFFASCKVRSISATHGLQTRSIGNGVVVGIEGVAGEALARQPAPREAGPRGRHRR